MKTSSTFKSIRDSMFRTINNVCWDLQTGQVGIKTTRETYTLKVVEDQNAYELQKNPLQFFSLPIPAWALRVPLNSLVQGDVVVLDNDKLAFFVAQGEKPSQIHVLKPHVGDVTVVDVGTNILLGQNDSILCVKNIMPMTGNNAALANQLPMLLLFLERGSSEDEIGKMLAMMMFMGDDVGMTSMLPLLLMSKGDSKLDSKSLMLMMMQMQNGGGDAAAAGGMDSMLPMLLMGDGGFDSKMLAMMMQMQNGGGDATAAGGMTSMLPLLLMSKGDSKLDSKSLMLMMMQMQMQNGGGDAAAAGGMDSMLPMLLMGDGGFDSKMLAMMMMGGFGGEGGMTNMAPFFMMNMFGDGDDVEDMTYNEDVGHWIDDAGIHYDYEGDKIAADDERYWHEDGTED